MKVLKPLHIRSFVFVCASLLISTLSASAVSFSVSPQVVSNNFQGVVTQTVSGIAASSTVRFERYLDVNSNNIIDSQDVLGLSFTVTDGQAPFIGGVRNLNVPGDDDGAANGTVQANLFYPSVEGTVDRIAANYLIRVSDTAGGFAPLTNIFTVKQQNLPQGVRGKVVDGGTGAFQSNVVVVLVNFNGPGGFGTVSDAAGNFQINSPPGNYTLITLKNGFYSDQNAGHVTVVTNVFGSHNITNFPAPLTISGTVSDAVGGQPLTGVPIRAKTTNDLFSVTFTDTNGNYSLPVSPQIWAVNPSENGLARIGYVGFQNNTNVNTSAGNVSGVNFGMQKANALIYGNIKDTQNNPLVGVSLFSDDGGLFETDGLSFPTNGDYCLGVLAGNWFVGADFVGGFLLQGTNVTLSAGQAVRADLRAQAVTAHLIGHVIDNFGVPLGFVQISADDFIGDNVSAQTDAAGNFDLGVFGGVWHLQLNGGDAASRGVVFPDFFVNVTNGVNVTNIQYLVLKATAQITGLVTSQANGSPITSLNVTASATINGTNYFAGNGFTDSSGNYFLIVANGNWNVSLDCSDLTARGFNCPSGVNVPITGANGVANFMVQPLVACTPAPSGLVAWFRAEGNANDALGVNNGTLSNGVAFASGEVGQAFSLDGVDDEVSIPGSSAFDFGTNSFAIDFWLNTTDSSASQRFFMSKSPGDGQNLWAFSRNRGAAADKLTFELCSGNACDTVSSLSSINNGAWHHVAVTRSGTTLTLYVDGVAEGTTTTTRSMTILGAILIGGLQNYQSASGLFDEVDFFNRALTATEIQSIYNAGSAGKCSSTTGGADVRNYHVVKGQLFKQTGATPSAQTTNAAFSASVNTLDFPASSFVSNASVTLPNRTVINLTEQNDSFEFQDARSTLSALNSAYPNGTYTLSFQTVHDGNFSVPLSLTGDAYPNTPTILNFSGTQTLNPFADYTLSWGAFTGGTVNDFIQVRIKDNSITNGDDKIFSTGENPGDAGALNGTATSVVIPANTLQVGKTYSARLLFGKFVSVDTNSYPGVIGFTAYFKQTDFSITTAGSSTIPLITNERLPGRQINLQYSAQLMATGGTGGYTFSIASGALPTGLALASNGQITGTPTASGTFNFTVRVKDSASHTFSQPFSITIYPTPPGFPIATSMESELAFSTAFDGTNFLVAIQGDANSSSNITAQLISPTGAPLGSRISVGRTGHFPSVAFGGGIYLMAWQDSTNSPNDDIYGQRINTAGQLVGAPFAVNSAAGEQKLDPFSGIAFNGTNFFVLWRDKGPGGGSSPIYGQFVSPNGGLIGSEIRISDNGGNSAAVAFNGNNFLVAWTEDFNNTDIYGQFLYPDGTRLNGNFVIDANSLPSDDPIDIAFNGERFLVAFHDQVSSNNWDLFARFVDVEFGVSSNRLTIASGAVDQHFPSVITKSGRYFITWLEGLGGPAAPKVKGRFFDSDGTAGAEFVFIDNAGPRAPITRVVAGGKKLLAVTDWVVVDTSGDHFETFDGDVYGQFFSIGPPQILVQPKSRTVTTGSTVTFSVLAVGTPPLSFQWQFNGTNISGATNATYSIPNAQPANEGSYSVIITNAFGSIASDAATLTVLTPPMISVQPVSQIVAIGANVTFSVSATGGGTITYQWRLNGVNIPGEAGSSLTLLNVQPSNNGNYSVVVGNEIAAVDSQIARLFVTADALGFTDNFADRVTTNSSSGVGSGSNVGATKEIGEPNHAGNPGGKSVWYAWQAPASGIATFSTLGSSFDTLLAVYTGTNVNNLTLIARDNDRAGFLTSRVMFNAISNVVYNIAIDGSYGASGDIILSWSLEVTANLLPEILVQPQSQIVAQGSNATLTVVANTNAGPLAYQWLFKGDAISGATDSTLTIFNVQASNSGPYRVLITTISADPRSVLSAAALVQVGASATVIALDKFLDVTPLGSGPSQSSLLGELRGNHGHPNSAPAGGFTGTQIFNTFGATKEPGEPNHCGVPGGASYWFAYQAPASGRLFVNTSNSTFDTVLAIYTGPAIITNFSDIVSVDCANEPGFGTESLAVPVTNGETLYIVVDGVGGASGAVTLNYSLVSTPSITAQPQSKTVNPGSNVTFTVTSTGGSSLTYQWRLNGSDIADATDSAYTLVASNVAVAGSYSVVVSNDADVVVSSVATLTIVGETTRPKVAITSPADGSRASNTVVTVSGTASDNAGIYQVLWQINGGDNQVADGTTNWSASVPLNPGTNTFRIYSVDTSGNTASPTNSRKFVYVVLQPFTLITNGTGTLTPSQGGQMLEIGKNYTVTAKPGAGQLFINWSGGSSSTNPVLTFTMQTNLMLQANFLANPFIPRSGTFSGLFYQTNVVAHQSSGFFTIKVTSSGSFSCKLLTAGLKPSAKGVFTFEGFASVSVTRKGLTPLTMSLTLDVSNATDKVLGTISDSNWVAALEGDRAVFNSVSNIAPQNGKYTLAFVHQTNSATMPGGDGVGTVTVDTAGKLALKGTLADGVKASQKTAVSKQGQWPFYLNLYSGQGSTIGWLTFTNRGTSSIEGDVSWIKTGVVPGKNYTNGFTNEVIGAGSHYPNPVPAGRILAITNGEVILSANNLDPSLTNGIFLNTNNAVTVTSGTNDNLKLTLTASSGAVKGTFTHPTNLSSTKITGIILPEQNVIRGFFLNSTNSGAVILQSQ